MNEFFLKALRRIVNTPQKICILSHKNPDGDALGSSLAMYHYLIQKGHQVSVIMPNSYPMSFHWMPSQSDIIKFDANPEKTIALLDESNVIFTMDFNSLSRVGRDMAYVLEQTKGLFVMIDHHESPESYARHIYSDSTMGSTSEMLYGFIKQMKDLDLVDVNVATCLYTGIMTDTGNFRFPRTTSNTHTVIADLIERGADNVEIYTRVFEQKTFESIQLLGFALSHINKLSSFNTVYFTLTKEDLLKYNFRKGDTENIVNFGLSIKNVRFAVIFTESLQEGYVKISFRSKGSFKANVFAQKHFEGGGHINASGGKSDENLQQTILNFKSYLKLYQKELLDEK